MRLWRGSLTLALLRAMHRGVSDNPVISKEVRETLGTRRAAVLFAIFTGALALTVFLAWPRGERLLGSLQDTVADRLFDLALERQLPADHLVKHYTE